MGAWGFAHIAAPYAVQESAKGGGLRKRESGPAERGLIEQDGYDRCINRLSRRGRGTCTCGSVNPGRGALLGAELKKK
jgi:hypothetical protein